jgi:hypothetical protein
MRRECHTFRSADRIVNDGERDIYTTGYLNTIEVANVLHHESKVKIGSPVILLRNLNPADGMCNGTRLRILRCGERVIKREILSGRHSERQQMPICIQLSRTPRKHGSKEKSRILYMQRYFVGDGMVSEGCSMIGMKGRQRVRVFRIGGAAAARVCPQRLSTERADGHVSAETTGSFLFNQRC